MRGGRRTVQGERITDRLKPYSGATTEEGEASVEMFDELMARVVMLLDVMGRQPRSTIEDIVSPRDRALAGRAVDKLIEAAVVSEDDAGRLGRMGGAR